MKRFIAICMFFIGGFIAVHPAQAKSQDFLQQGQIRLLSVSDAWLDHRLIGMLWDNDPETGVTLRLEKSAPLEIVFEAIQDVVAPETVRIQCKPQTGKSPLMKVELLVSTLSPKAGFQSVGEKTLPLGSAAHTFSVKPASAKWVMLRLEPVREFQEVVGVEWGIAGEPGSPRSNYAFKESPSSALQVIEKLRDGSSEWDVTPEEKRMFANAREGRLGDGTLAEAVLIASGVTAAPQRQHYLSRLETWQLQAGKAVAQKHEPFTKGEALLEWMHAHALQGGYQEDQTRLSVLLDSGRYNCLSAAALYMILGKRLGLDVRVIEVPDHAFAILYDGARHVDVETTSPAGFDPASRPEVLKQFTARTGFDYISEKNQAMRREVGESGLVALFYYNIGVELAKKNDFQAALGANFRALNMDPEIKTAVHNVLAVLANWSKALVEKGQFVPATQVVETGLALAPKDATLLNNQQVVWEKRINAAVDAKRSDEALALLKEADKRMPDGRYKRLQSWVYIKPGMQWVRQKAWQKALDAAAQAKGKVAPAAAVELAHWQGEVYLDWSNDLLARKRFAEAMDVLDRARTFDPTDRRFAGNQGFVLYTWAEYLYGREGQGVAEALLAEQIGTRPADQEIRRAGEAYVHARIQEAQKHGDAEVRMAGIIRRCEPLIAHVPDMHEQVRNSYDILAQDSGKRKDWQNAVGMYRAALKKYPGDRKLLHNQRVTWIDWLRHLEAAGSWEAALEVCEQALDAKIDPAVFTPWQAQLVEANVESLHAQQGADAAEARLRSLMAKYARNQAVQKSGEKYIANRLRENRGKPDGMERSAAVLARNRDLVKVQAEIDNLEKQRIDQTARVLADEGRFEAAIAIYEKGLAAYPRDAVLENNQKAMWDEWIQQAVEKQAWPQALERCRTAMQRNAADGHYTNKAAYVTQEYVRDLLARKDVTEIRKAFGVLAEVFPNAPFVREVIAGLVGQAIQEQPLHAPEKAEQQWSGMIAAYENALGPDQDSLQFRHVAYDRLAQHAGSREDWARAEAVYARSLKQVPHDTYLQKNHIAAWNQWATGYVEKAQWRKAMDIYEKALAVYPSSDLLKNNYQYCRQQLQARPADTPQQP